MLIFQTDFTQRKSSWHMSIFHTPNWQKRQLFLALPVLCSICPGNECSARNKYTCTQCPCEWHRQAQQNFRRTTRPSGYKVYKNICLTITEYILPNELSQFSLSPSGFASNVISVLVGLRFLSEDLLIPTSDGDEKLQITVQKYREIMATHCTQLLTHLNANQI